MLCYVINAIIFWLFYILMRIIGIFRQGRVVVVTVGIMNGAIEQLVRR